MPEIELNGATLHYDEAGQGAPIVFSHGLLWSGSMFAEQVAALSTRYRCLTYDHRGQGQSKTSSGPYDMELLTEDAARFIEAVGAQPCHFVGLSMGGFVGLRLAMTRPELLRSLTLIGSAADAEPRLNGPKYRGLLLAARQVGFGPLIPVIMRIMFGAAFLRDPARAALRQHMADALRQLQANRVGAALEAWLRRRPLLAELSSVTTPTLVLHGEEDRAISLQRAQRTAQAIPRSRLVILPRAGHTASVEEPAAITERLSLFIG